MGIIEAIFVIALPWIVKAITNVSKRTDIVSLSDNRITIIRGVVAALALFGATLAQVIGDSGEISPDFIQTSVYTIYAGVVATLLYISEKKRKK